MEGFPPSTRTALVHESRILTCDWISTVAYKIQIDQEAQLDVREELSDGLTRAN